MIFPAPNYFILLFILAWSGVSAEPIPYRVADLRSELATQLSNLTPLGSSVFFTRNIQGSKLFLGEDLGFLYRSDGSSTGTKRIGSFIDDSLVYIPSGDAHRFATCGDQLYFSGSVGNQGKGLYKIGESDAVATRIGTVGEPNSLTTVGSQVFFTALDPSFSTFLWKTDGTAEGTVKVVGEQMRENSEITSLREMDGKLYFYGRNRSNTLTLFQSDGTNAGTIGIKTIPLDPYAYCFSFEDTVYFTTGYGFFKSIDPTVAPQLVKSGSVCGARVLHESIYLLIMDSSNHLALWKSDGTIGGTAKIIDLPDNGYTPADWIEFTWEMDGELFFTLSKDQGFLKLWKTDGTADGTVPLLDAPQLRWYIREHLLYNDRLYFAISNIDGSEEVWSTDGSSAGTGRFTTSSPGFSNNPPQLRVAGSALFYLTFDQEIGNELFAFDDTPAGLPELTASNPSVARFSARFDLTIDSNRSPTTLKLRYGPTQDYGTEQEIPFSPSNGSLPESVVAEVSGLTHGSTYHYRWVALNSQGEVSTEDRIFTTVSNQSPAVSPKIVLVYDHSPITFTAAELLSNASDPESDQITVNGFGPATSGASITTDGDHFTYTPAAGFTGIDRISFTVIDSHGASTASEIKIHVAGDFGHPWLHGGPSVVIFGSSSPSEGIVYFLSSANPGQTYIVQRSTDLEHWEDIGDPVVGESNGSIGFPDDNPPAGQAFYRLVHPTENSRMLR